MALLSSCGKSRTTRIFSLLLVLLSSFPRSHGTPQQLRKVKNNKNLLLVVGAPLILSSVPWHSSAAAESQEQQESSPCCWCSSHPFLGPMALLSSCGKSRTTRIFSLLLVL